MPSGSSGWGPKGTFKVQLYLLETGLASSLNTTILLKTLEGALQLQIASKLCFRANFQLVIGKHSKRKIKSQNRTLGLLRNP